MTTSSEIKAFYDKIQFPGPYTHDQMIQASECTDNVFLKFIEQYLRPGQQVLDAGCGSGLISNLFAKKFASDFTAVDFSNSIKFGEAYAKQHGITNIFWAQEDLTAMKIQQQFDLVICQGVLHHVPEYKKVLSLLKNATKTGGILLLGLYHPYGKILKKYFKLNYGSKILEIDQEQNALELSFSFDQVLDLCQDLEFLNSTPPYTSEFVAKIGSLLSSANGGLILYAFRKSHV